MKYLIPVIILILLSTSVLALTEQVILKKNQSKEVLGHRIEFLDSELSKVSFKVDDQVYSLIKHQKGQKEDIMIEVISIASNILDPKEDYVVFLITNENMVRKELKSKKAISSDLTAVKKVPKEYKEIANISLESQKEENKNSKTTSKIFSFWIFILNLF